MPEVKLLEVKKLLEKLEHDIGTEDIDLSFEFLMNTLFPDAAEYFRNFCTRQFIDGYNNGYQQALEDNDIGVVIYNEGQRIN